MSILFLHWQMPGKNSYICFFYTGFDILHPPIDMFLHHSGRLFALSVHHKMDNFGMFGLGVFSFARHINPSDKVDAVIDVRQQFTDLPIVPKVGNIHMELAIPLM